MILYIWHSHIEQTYTTTYNFYISIYFKSIILSYWDVPLKSEIHPARCLKSKLWRSWNNCPRSWRTWKKQHMEETTQLFHNFPEDEDANVTWSSSQDVTSCFCVCSIARLLKLNWRWWSHHCFRTGGVPGESSAGALLEDMLYYRGSQIDGPGKSWFVCHQYGKQILSKRNVFLQH